MSGEKRGIYMKEILIIAPVQEIYEKSLKIIENRGYRNIEVVQGSMGEGVKIAEKAAKRGVRIIVTRGGTYKLIKENVNIPLVEIKVTASDLVESLEKVKDIDGTVAVVGYNNVVDGFDILRKIINTNIEKFELKQDSDIYSIVEKNVKRGIKTYIGDSNLAPIIDELNCNGVIISSTEESILNAIQEARRIRDAIRIEKHRIKKMEMITDFVHDGVIAIDEHENITLFNGTAEQLFKLNKQDVIGRNIREVINETTLHEQLVNPGVVVGNIQNINNCIVATNQVPIIVDGEIKGAVATFQDITELQSVEYKIRKKLSESGFEAKYKFEDIIYCSDKIKECIEIAKKYSEYDSPVLIMGESGVGKELFCQSMHNHSERRNGPFVAINCAAISPSLIESEFFGYEEGAFTGARKKGKIGVFELAHKGTLFLDEISEIPLELQGRLLRVLQEKQVMRIGGNKVIPIDVKIICASNRDLKAMMRENLFRKDLYFRISILNLYIPALRERREDIIKLAEYFIIKYSAKHNKNIMKIHDDIKMALLRYKYEGNVRELEGIIEKSMVIDSFRWLKNEDKVVATNITVNNEYMDLRTWEKNYIKCVYDETDRNVKKTCDILKINRSTLWRKLKEIDYENI